MSTWLITGCSTGLGRELALAVLKRGDNAVVTARNAGSVEDITAGYPDSALALALDVTDRGQVAGVVREATDRFGAIDVLVNNVGICIPRDGFLSVDDAGWEKLFQVNLMSAVRASRAAIPAMVEAGGGAVITTASESGLQPAPVFSDYAVTKGSLHILTKLLANEFSRAGVRCNSVTPGPIRTPAWGPGGVVDKLAKEWGMELEEGIEHFVREVRGMPLGKIGEPEDVAAMVCFLASDLAKQITGSDFRVDGGQVATIV